ncbi:N-carbamoylsarcosine amidase [Pseudomonas amygdali pv. eriobotryae]|nr:N-carbamoylsarcosine amidase [Pseudomonas amygdali pv. eriobotryae]
MTLENDVYTQQGFGSRLGFGQTPALVIVDFVEGFTNPAQFGGGNILDAVARTVPLLDFARKAGWPIAHTRVVYAEDGSDGNAFTLKVPSLLMLTEDEHASQIVPALKPKPGELVIRKQLPSAFADTPLASWLRLKGVDTLIVAGCTTSGCIRATVLDSMGCGLRTVVVEDCVGDRAQGPHEANLFDMQQKYCDLMTSTDIYKHFEGLSNHD